eukprot:COSAG05_NODE_1868_length_3927_cov_18.028316_3_plen_94_part_00
MQSDILTVDLIRPQQQLGQVPPIHTERARHHLPPVHHARRQAVPAGVEALVEAQTCSLRALEVSAERELDRAQRRLRAQILRTLRVRTLLFVF